MLICLLAYGKDNFPTLFYTTHPLLMPQCCPWQVCVLGTAVNRHHGQGNSYKNNFNWGQLTGSEIQSIIIKEGTQKHPGRQSARGADSSTSSSEVCQLNTGFQAARMRVLKLTPTEMHLLQQGHTYYNRDTPSNSASPWAQHIQTITKGLLQEY